MGNITEDVFNNIAHTLTLELRNLNEEHSQLIIILDRVDEMKKGIDSFVQKIERFTNCTITEDDRITIERLLTISKSTKKKTVRFLSRFSLLMSV